jgi:hypothetical protein
MEVIDTSLRQMTLAQGFENFFKILYTIPPQIDVNIPVALEQCYCLTEIALRFGNIQAVRMLVSNNLVDRRQELFTAIALDPLRWLKLACLLESKVIFAEALIHCAGGFPGKAWPTPLTYIDKSLQAIIFKKATHLEAFVNRTRIKLLSLTIMNEKQQGLSTNLEGSTWAVVHIFREWLVKQIQRADRSRPEYQRSDYFRKIYHGGDAYLKEDEVTILVEQVTKTYYDINDLLGEIKKWAKVQVEPLLKNNLMISPEVNNIDYLTCTEVTEKDFPW